MELIPSFHISSPSHFILIPWHSLLRKGFRPQGILWELRRKYSSTFRFDLCFETDTDEDKLAEDELIQDMEVQECVSNGFKIGINFLVVPGTSE